MRFLANLKYSLPLWGGLGWGLLCASCTGEIDHTFSRLPARFVMQNVQTCPPLNLAVGNMGQWCTVEPGNNVYIVTGAKETVQMNLTALTGYQGFYLGVSGLIIGLPNIPEMGADLPVVTCYDLACSNCYRDTGIARTLSVDFSAATATCRLCGRTYNLNNRGIISSDHTGRPLERYRTFFNGQTLTVNN